MKKKFQLAQLLILASVLLFAACNNDENGENEPNDTATQTNQANDVARLSSEFDIAIGEGITLLENNPSSNARSTAPLATSCGIDSATFSPNKIIIQYDEKANCVVQNKKRGGIVEIELTKGNKWSDTGAVLTYTFKDYKITRLSDNKSITINGTHTITNVSGGLVSSLSSIASKELKHRIEAKDMQIAFDNGTKRTWSSYRTRTFQLSGSDTEITISGKDSSKVAFWGKNRQGNDFTTSIELPIVLSTCNSGSIENLKPIQGEEKHLVTNFNDVTVTFGVDALGNPVNNCTAIGYKINWESVMKKTDK